MGFKETFQDTRELDALIERVLDTARIPGAAVAVVAEGGTVFSKGYGYRDLRARLPVTAETIFPIASTTKAINAVLLGMLVDEGRLAWDTPIQHYLPGFRLSDPWISAQVTVRDLIVMRTGLPRHDWVWLDHETDRKDLVERLRYLDLSVGFRERYQYNNLTVTAAGYLAEVITGKAWNDLIRERILEPLEMNSTGFTLPAAGNVTLSYHENHAREILQTRRLAGEVTAPSGGAIHSHVLDMARWALFNLNGGRVGAQQLIQPKTLAEIHSPQIAGGPELNTPTVSVTYGMGWLVDTYNGHWRVSHGGYLHDVHTDLCLFPKSGIAVVCFTNFGCPTLSKLINQSVFDWMLQLKPVNTLEEKLADYEKKIEDNRARIAAIPRRSNTTCSHDLTEYPGIYSHPGYGKVEILGTGAELTLKRYGLVLPLEHWHYDTWVPKETDLFMIHLPQPFDRSGRLVFETNADGAIAAVLIHLEPSTAPIRFTREVRDPT